MFELFVSSKVSIGWILFAAAMALQIGLLASSALSPQKWKWRSLFAAELLLSVGTVALCWCYNHTGSGWEGMRYMDDAIYTCLISICFIITLFVSWVFWMNRKPV